MDFGFASAGPGAFLAKLGPDVTGCGDGIPNGLDEPCDDGNITSGDGCSADCEAEDGHDCDGAPSVCVPDCGDLVMLGGESCDDGNNASGDGCSSDCRLEEIEPNGGASLRAEIIEGQAETCESNGIDSRLSLFDPTGYMLVEDDDSGRGLCSLIDGTGLSPKDLKAHGLKAGTYFLRVAASPNAQMGATAELDYRLVVTVRAP